MTVVHDIYRPDVNDTPPKMQALCEQVQKTLQGIAPYLQISTNDNIMSSIWIKGAMEPKETWANGIFHNAPRYFILSITPQNEKRYYDPNDPKVCLELTSMGRNMSKLRKYTAPPDKVIQKLKDYILAHN